MNAIELLKQDHRTVQQLFSDHEAAGENAHAEKQSLGEKIFAELDVHTQIEEEIFYPAARDGVGSETDKLVDEAYEEHQVAKRLIAELRSSSPSDDQWDAKMKVLKESVEHHIEEEEGELFPKVRTALGSAYLTELGERMATRKRELTKPSTSLGTSIVKMVSRAYDSLTGGETPKRRGTRTAATAKRAATGTKRTAKKTSAKRPKASGKMPARPTTKRRAQSVAAKRTTSAKKRASSARTRSAVGKKSTRKQGTKRRRSARR